MMRDEAVHPSMLYANPDTYRPPSQRKETHTDSNGKRGPKNKCAAIEIALLKDILETGRKVESDEEWTEMCVKAGAPRVP